MSEYVEGREDTIRLLIAALLAGGHVLVEGLPGTAKTLVSRLFAQSIGGEFRRIQLTPDMLPSDITGFELYAQDGSARFIPGPIFGHVVLADELNRTTPRTQAAFLEAMQEHQVTIEGVTHALPEPFLVIASQVPFGGDGTYPLTDVQADRFMLRVWSGYPTPEMEMRILEHSDILERPNVEAVTNPEGILRLRDEVKKIHVSELIRRYIVDLIDALRKDQDVLLAPGPRATMALYRGARAIAYLDGRAFVIPDDVKALAPGALEHRVRPTIEAETDDFTPATLVARVLATVPVPRGDR